VTQDRHRRIEALFEGAVALTDSEERHRFLTAACGDDAGLRRDVERLLASYAAWSSDLPPEPPRRIACGPYVCEELLGSGGMGLVYRARRADGQFEQLVAIKFLRVAAATEVYRTRFLAERQILARLNHPNIARLLDGGVTAQGEPYLAMELVEGEPIDAYCDRHRLTVAARLKLFQDVLSAVAYAHRNLVVHRDLKPANILVTAEGTPKLLDFGTSKLIEDDATTTAPFALTPAYASPEQLRGEPSATASDIFSLGAVLFRLLTGSAPFGEGKSYAGSVERALRETSPSKPDTAVGINEAEARSTSVADLQRTLRGDLAAILRKALAHNPEERYDSAAAFVEDLRRYSENRPVLARRQNWAYVLRKGLRRHAQAAAVGGVIAGALAVAAWFSLAQARSARREALRAQTANQFLTEVFQVAVRDTATRHDLTVRELLELAAERAPAMLDGDPAVAAEVDFSLGSALAWRHALPEAGKLFERSIGHARRSGDVAREAKAVAALAGISYMSGRPEQAWDEALRALGMWKTQPGKFPPSQAVDLLREAGTTLLYLRPADSVHREYLEQAVAIARRQAGVPPASRAAAMQRLAESYINLDRRYDDALPLLIEAVALGRQDPTQGAQLILSLQSLGRANRFLGRFAEDEAAQREAFELLTKMNGTENPTTASQHAIWAQSLIGTGRVEEAYEHSRQALADMRRFAPAPASPVLWTNLSVAANAACMTGRYRECETLVREALRTLGPSPAAADLRFLDARAVLALSLAGQGKKAEARPLIDETLQRNEAANRRPFYTARLEALRGPD
jgi:tetratricopeptide (TPR) repeat protein